MALTIGVNKKSKIYIDDVKLCVLNTDGDTSISIRVESTPPVDYMITDIESVEILPSVFVSCGKPSYSQESHLPRLVFEAPKSIVILREHLYNRKYD